MANIEIQPPPDQALLPIPHPFLLKMVSGITKSLLKSSTRASAWIGGLPTSPPFLLSLRRPTEAESAARRSVDLDGTNYRARSLLAVALVEQGKLTSEVEKSLRHAADDLPAAHLLLGKVFIATGRLEDAEGELRSYLASGLPRERSTVQAWMQKHDELGVRQPVAQPDRPTPQEISVWRRWRSNRRRPPRRRSNECHCVVTRRVARPVSDYALGRRNRMTCARNSAK